MEPKDALKMMTKDAKDLEATVYHFEEVLTPRIQADKKILDTLRVRITKLKVLIERKKIKDVVITDEEIAEALPASMR